MESIDEYRRIIGNLAANYAAMNANKLDAPGRQALVDLVEYHLGQCAGLPRPETAARKAKLAAYSPAMIDAAASAFFGADSDLREEFLDDESLWLAFIRADIAGRTSSHGRGGAR